MSTNSRADTVAARMARSTKGMPSFGKMMGKKPALEELMA